MNKLRYLDISDSSANDLSCLDNLGELEELITNTCIGGYDKLRLKRLRVWSLIGNYRVGLRDKLSELYRFVNILCQ